MMKEKMEKVNNGYLFREETKKYDIGFVKVMYYEDKDLDKRIRDICWFCRKIGTENTWGLVDKKEKMIVALTEKQFNILKANMKDFEKWNVNEIDHNDLVDIVINGTM